MTDFQTTLLQFTEYPSVKIKLDELILEWLNINETNKLIDYLLDEASTRTSEGVIVPPPELPNINPPPRSPTSNRSPKKRLQSEISTTNLIDNKNEKHVHNSSFLSNSHRGSGNNNDDRSFNSNDNDNDNDLQTTRRRSNIDSIPVFFVKGRGHKSRKPIPEGM